MSTTTTIGRRNNDNNNNVNKGGGRKISGFWCAMSFLMGIAVTTMSNQQKNDLGMMSTSNASGGISKTTTVAPAVLDGSTTTKVITTKSFVEIGLKTGTDKVVGEKYLSGCLEKGDCIRKECERKECRPWGHWYHTMYQQWIAKYALPTSEPFQFLEIGFFTGKGYATYNQFFEDAPKAELHSMEISCIEEGPRSENKWPKEWGNSAIKSPNYQSLLDTQRLHCVDASNLTLLNDIWTNKMHRPDAPPLRIVVDDASHLSTHMVTSVFFWFPRIEPGGLLIVEDIQPIQEANRFRTQFMPQIMSDLHYCGDPSQQKDESCFPQLWPLLQSIHCEMHICVFERNQEPAQPNLSLEKSKPPPNALDLSKCYSFAHPFGLGA